MTEFVDLLAPEVRKDPYPTYARLRCAPVQQVLPMRLWAVSRYEDVEYVLKNPQLFSSSGMGALFRPGWLAHNPIGDSIGVKDGAEHAKLRALLTHAFTPRAIARLEVQVRQVAAALADRLRMAGEADFVADFASPLPGRVIAELMGLDHDLHREFRRWTNHLLMITPMYPGDELATAIRNTVSEMESYMTKVLASRRASPRDDTVSDLLRAEVDGRVLTESELIAFLFILLMAGYESTQYLLSTLMLGFTDRPAEFTQLRADQSLIPAYVDEGLRKEPPGHCVMRLTLADANVGGVTVPAGSLVAVLIGSANHDESRFAEPEHFDASRSSKGGLAFGHGAHYCLGAPLARLEARIAIEELGARFRGFERLSSELEWNTTLLPRGPVALQIRALLA